MTSWINLSLEGVNSVGTDRSVVPFLYFRSSANIRLIHLTRQEGVGLVAINDALYLEAGVYQLLKIHFHESPYYTKLVDLFLSTTRKTVYGQSLDLLSTPPGRDLDLSRFTLERYANIIKYKTAYYSFSLPVRLALYLAGVHDDKSHRDAESVLLKMGHFFQVQDDYLDCFGDHEVIGKIGTDIQDGKCCWPVIIALQTSNKDQRKILEDNYAKSDPRNVEAVKNLYQELKIKEAYHEYEERMYQEICSDIHEVSKKSKLPAEIFYDFLAKIYKRQK